MKRRRDIGPKRVKNRPALIKFIILALIVAALGIILAFTANYLIGPPPETPTQDSQEKNPSLIYLLPGLLGIITLLVVIALLFFGFRAYMMGTKSRKTIQAGRKKFKPKY